MPELNCHFVSRFLTRPWEYGQRHLWYFDFDSDRVGSQSSRKLFASRGTNSSAVEARLNRIIETPLATARAELADEASEQQDRQLPWPLFRALALLMMLQPLRAPDHPERAEMLEQTILRSDDELDQIATAASQKYQLGRITVRPDAPLLYASAGFFPLFAPRQDDYWASAIAIPISVHHVFVAVPRTMDWNAATQLWAQNGSGMVANASVGLSAKVVLPPDYRDARSDEEIASMMKEMRAMVGEFQALCREKNDALARLNDALLV